MEALISVIVPVFNVFPFLREALDSVVRQTYRNLEIIIVDDGSTDGSGEICDEYLSDPRVQVIHQENRGLSAARNVGLDVMTGAFVAFLDSDDVFRPEMIQTMVDGLMDSGAEIAVCGFTSHSFAFRFRKREVISGTEALRGLFLGRMNYSVWNKVYRHDIWEDIRFSEGRVFEDVPVMLELFRKCNRVLLLPEILMVYRIRPGSISRSASPEIIRDYVVSEKTRNDQAESLFPDLLDEEDIAQFREISLRDMISLYSRWVMSSHNSDNRHALGDLRRLIDQSVDQVLRGRRSAKTQCFIALYRLCPQAVLPMSSVYHALRRFFGGNRTSVKNDWKAMTEKKTRRGGRE